MGDLEEENRELRERITQLESAISDRLRLERSLLESNARLRLAIDATRLGFWRWEAQADQLEWDDRLLVIFGAERSPTNYEGFLGHVHPDDREAVRAVVARAYETGVYQTFEHRLAPRADGGERWVLCVATAQKGPNGEVESLQGGVLDITEKKSIVTHLQEAERVQTIGQLSAGFAHNFNNLLAAIIPHLELEVDRCRALDPAATAALEASLRARDLVRSMLALAGKQSTDDPSPAPVQDVVQRALSACRMTFPKEIELHEHIDPSAGHVAMPSDDLEQVLLNLLFNARDALEGASGSRRIDVVVERVPGDGGRVRFRVTDSGPGIPDAVRPRIFDPFFTTKIDQRRPGLGLASALARARAANGELELERCGPEGSSFSLVLPEASDAHEASGARATGGSVRSGGETVLLVDDEPLVRGVVRRLLETEGYAVLEAGSANEAREVLGRVGETVDAIILDQSMPREPGLEALPSLVALTDASVILFTGLAPEPAPGTAAVLEKPAKAAEIFRVLRSVLDERRPAARG